MLQMPNNSFQVCAPYAEPAKARTPSFLDLPTELISRVFHLAVHSSQSRSSKTLGSILLVCRDARDIALHTPSLWTDLVLTDSRSLDVAFMHLDRSMALPVDVTIVVNCRNHKSLPCKEGYRTLLQLLQALQGSMSRWRTLDVNLPSCWLAQEAMAACVPFVSHLEILDVRTGHSDAGDFATPLPSVLLGMSQLRSLNFHWYTFRWIEAASLPSIRDISLTDYYMDDPNLVKELLELIRACPNLETLELSNISERLTTSISPVSNTLPVVLPSLRRLSLASCGIGRTSLLFKNARFPNLITCELSSLGAVDALLETLASRSSHSFRQCIRFRLTDCIFKKESASKLASCLPTSALLELVECDALD